jgi:hypothetical protein
MRHPDALPQPDFQTRHDCPEKPYAALTVKTYALMTALDKRALKVPPVVVSVAIALSMGLWTHVAPQ